MCRKGTIGEAEVNDLLVELVVLGVLVEDHRLLPARLGRGLDLHLGGGRVAHHAKIVEYVTLAVGPDGGLQAHRRSPALPHDQITNATHYERERERDINVPGQLIPGELADRLVQP